MTDHEEKEPRAGTYSQKFTKGLDVDKNVFTRHPEDQVRAPRLTNVRLFFAGLLLIAFYLWLRASSPGSSILSIEDRVREILSQTPLIGQYGCDHRARYQLTHRRRPR